jgi:hypothetical protein
MKNFRRAWVAMVVIGIVVAAAIWWRNRPDRFAAMMADTYGAYDAGNKAWIGLAGQEPHRLYRVCAEREVDVRGQKHLLLAVCGDTTEMDSHAAGGIVDMYVLKGDRSAFTPVAQKRGIESGGFGHAGSVAVMKLGPAFFGFAVSDGWTGQGYTLETVSLYVPKGDTLTEALAIRTGTDNGGTAECSADRGKCNRVERKLTADVSAAGETVYPITVVQSGAYDGVNMDGTFKLTFNKKRWAYVAPKKLDLQIE